MTSVMSAPSARSWDDIQADLDRDRRSHDRLAWYIVHFVGKTDMHATDVLKRLDFELYYPNVREMRPLARKKLSRKQRQSGLPVMRPQLVPMFPRYCFVRFDMTRDGWREVFAVAGVAGLVCAGARPVWVPDSLIGEIRAREVNGAVSGKETARVVFGVGENVRIAGGPFDGFAGIVEKGIDTPIEELDPEERIGIAVELFGRATPIHLTVDQVEKL